MARQDLRRVVAVLGPTNTGKTHYAIERMCGHGSGVIGLPLRLLAREVYDKLVVRLGASKVALLTGEEKIKPQDARYWVCTVEAMPQELDVDFVAIDEVQLAADFDRGHVFTDRILNSRGHLETLLLGAETIEARLRDLLPHIEVMKRPRFSQLVYAGEKKISRQPPRSAIVAFSARDVYEIAELLRRQRGGAAVVLGALSPRTRNAQVELYQNGDVEFLVATDAIGMGLNLDVDHVAFAATRKFDGFQFRNLNPAELGQIAGRAGRHMNNGTFGVTGYAEPFDEELVERLESHHFEPISMLQWRNRDLNFASVPALINSLNAPPPRQGLVRAPTAEDQHALEFLARDPEIMDKAKTKTSIALLWDVCQLPDYRKIAHANHAELIANVFGFLVDQGRIPDDWFAQQVRMADKPEGDIDTLSNRLAHVRTWTYVANRNDWLQDAIGWQATTREVEDRLSDALHQQLIQRFVDRRTGTLMKGLRENRLMNVEINAEGGVSVEGHFVGQLKGLEFIADPEAEGLHGKAVRETAQKNLMGEIARRAAQIAESQHDAILMTGDGRILWKGETIAQLAASDDWLKPRVQLKAEESLTGPLRDKVEERLIRWVNKHIEDQLGTLIKLREAEGLEGLARGIAFRIVEGHGILQRAEAAKDIGELDQNARAGLRTLGVRFGAYHVYLPLLLKPHPRALIGLLVSLHTPGSGENLRKLQAELESGRTSLPQDKTIAAEAYAIMGFRAFGPQAVRIDILERLADLIRPALSWRTGQEGERPEGAEERGFRATAAMMSLLGSSEDDLRTILSALGYKRGSRPLNEEETKAWDERIAARKARNPEDTLTKPETVETWHVPPKKREQPQRGDGEAHKNAEQNRDGAQKHSGKPKHFKGKKGGKGRGNHAPSEPQNYSAKPKREKPVDQDSPFAALAQLKTQMSHSKK